MAYKYFLKIISIIFVISLLISLVTFKLFSHKKIKLLHVEKKPEIVIEKDTFHKGDSFYVVLQKTSLHTNDIYKVINLLSTSIENRYVKIGQLYEIEKSTDGIFKAFSYYPTPIEQYRVFVSNNNENESGITFEIEILKEELKTKYNILEGAIVSSLYEAIVNVEKGTPLIAVELTEIFAWQIDFLTETRQGDKFVILYETLDTDGGYSKFNKILSAQYMSKNYEYSAFLFKNSNGETSYYDENGKTLKRAFLKSPLNYKRISSHFSTSRMHPILKYRRPHLGIDYAATSGTPVVSIGDGKVVFAGWNGGFGNLIKIRHFNNYESWYGHLKGFAKGIKVGTHVKQGGLIGYVGMTGLATGPHLDFRFKQKNSFINYLTLKIPLSFSLPKNEMDTFIPQRDQYLKLISDIKSNN
ncbi:MAG: M23 family metallopeptidase [Elusimicrobiota bacterium]|nr:M23 family metallopeptidase [Elusimicrobiota bacterium]